jgi:plasmid stability protein
MGSVLIRNLDDAIIDKFRTKAELNGCSLEQELRDALRQTAPLTADQKRTMIRRTLITLPADAPDSTDLIREDRDRR